MIQREDGYGVVHNWNISCPVGEAGFDAKCYPIVSPQELCGNYTPELKITANGNDLFEISCELDLHTRADINIETGILSQSIVDKALSDLKADLSPLPEKKCGNYHTGFENTMLEDLPASLCIPDRKVARKWSCDHVPNYELAAKIITLGDRVDIDGQCQRVLTEDELAIACRKGFSLNRESGMCEKPVDGVEQI